MTKFIKPFAEILSCILILWTAAAHAQTPATGAFLSYNAYGGAAPLPLYFNINGVNYQFPFTTGGVVGPSTSVIGHCATWNNTTGTLLADAPCGAGGSGFPITLGSTSIAGSSTTTTIAGLTLTTPTLTTPTINGAALSGALSGSPTFSGVPLFTGLSVGTQVSCLGLTAGNALALSSAGCGAGGGLPSLTSGQFLGWANSGSGVATATNIVAGSGATFVCASGTCTIGATGSGGVSGPGSSVNGDLASWNGTAGNALSDSGILGSNIVQTSRTISTANPLTGGGGLSSNLNLGITIPNASLLGGNGTNFTSIGLGGCLSISGSTLNNTCAGTVTSVGLTMPTIFSVTGTPITSAGAFNVSLTSQSANNAFLAPNGSAGAPAFRAITFADLPTSGVTPGSCTTCNLTVNANGAVTAISNGSASSPAFFGGASTNTGNAYTIATTIPSGFTFTNQLAVQFTASAANTGAATLVVGSATAEPIEVQSTGGFSALIGGELVAGLEYNAVANTTCTCYVLNAGVGSQVVNPFTTATVTAAQWQHGAILVVKTSGQTATLPAANTLSPQGGLFIQAVGNSVTLAPNAGDAINGGTTGASITLASGGTYLLTTTGATGATAISETGGGGGGGSTIIPSVVSTGSTVTLPTSNATVVIKASASLAANLTCTAGLDITVKDGLGNDATDNITITNTAGTIDGAATFVMAGSHAGVPPYEARRMQCDASNNAWMVN